MSNELAKPMPQQMQTVNAPKVDANKTLQDTVRSEAVAELTKAAMAKAGALRLSPEETKELLKDFPDDAFQAGAGGKENLIYIEHAALRDRLNSVLGLGQWAMIVREIWFENVTAQTKNGPRPGIRVYSRVMLIVRECYVGESVGDMDYYPSNPNQNKGDAIEGSKTAAFRRCAKEFGIGLQAWRKDWCAGWLQRKGKGPMPAMQRGSDLKQPMPRTGTTPVEQTAEYAGEGGFEDPDEMNEAIETELLLAKNEAPVVETLPNGVTTMAVTIISAKPGRTGENKKGKWTAYNIETNGGLFSTFDADVFGLCEKHIGKRLGLDFETNPKGYKCIIQTRAV